MKKLNESEVEEISDSDKIKIIYAFIHFEHAKTQTFIEQAYEQLSDTINQGEYLQIVSAVAKIYRDPELAKLAVRISRQKENETESDNNEDKEIFDIEKIEKELLGKVESAIANVLNKSGKNKNEIDSFLSACKTAKEYNNITEDLSDEEWEVTVQLPGHILYHNSDQELYSDLPLPDENIIDDRSDSNTIRTNNCTWTFTSSALDNQDVTLFVTSFVPVKN